MREPYILVLSASGGAGHLRAGQALEAAARSFEHPVRVKHYDCLDLTSKTFKKLYSESYLALVNKAPELWGYLYMKGERKPYEKRGLLKLFDELNYRKYLATLLEEKPDAMVCTHFLPYISVSGKLRKAGIHAPVFAVTTDFDAHQYWIDPIVRRYYVHAEESAWQLRSKGVAPEIVSVKGIPVMPQFVRRVPRKDARTALGIDPDRLTLLMVWGGFGVGKPEEMVEAVTALLGTFPDRPCTLILVCGKNEKLRKRISDRRAPAHVDVHTYGFVDNIHELMNASDVLISKAGGLTSAEAMALGLPMIIVDPIPGQESRNADIIVEQRAGWKALNIDNLGFKIKRIIEDPSMLESARLAAASLSRPNAAHDILADVYDEIMKGQYS